MNEGEWFDTLSAADRAELASDRAERQAFERGGHSDAEVLAGGLSDRAAVDPDLDALRLLHDLDAKVSKRLKRPVLDTRDREIITEALGLGRVRRSRIAQALAIDVSTVHRRVKRLLLDAGVLQRYALTLLSEQDGLPWKATVALLADLRIRAIRNGVEEEPRALPPGRLQELWRLSNAEAKANREQRASRRSADALVLRAPGLRFIPRPHIVPGSPKATITGPGPLPPLLRELVRSGLAERVHDRPRCLACGRFLPEPATGRPPKWCGEPCRNKVRRRSG